MVSKVDFLPVVLIWERWLSYVTHQAYQQCAFPEVIV